MRIKITTHAEMPSIWFPESTTAEGIDNYIKEKYGLQLNGKKHEWLWEVIYRQPRIQGVQDGNDVAV
jgi:hypothetical protein